MYDLIQSALTAAIEFTAVAGLTGIAAHAIWKQHTSWMSAYCPSVAPYTPDTQEEVAAPQPEPEVVAIAPEIQPEEVVETTEPETTVEEASEIDLKDLDPTTLRKLCTKHQIAWKHARGKNRHATKSMMVYQLQQRLTA
jgi:hypothetical protein